MRHFPRILHRHDSVLWTERYLFILRSKSSNAQFNTPPASLVVLRDESDGVNGAHDLCYKVGPLRSGASIRFQR